MRKRFQKRSWNVFASANTKFHSGGKSYGDLQLKIVKSDIGGEVPVEGENRCEVGGGAVRCKSDWAWGKNHIKVLGQFYGADVVKTVATTGFPLFPGRGGVLSEHWGWKAA